MSSPEQFVLPHFILKMSSTTRSSTAMNGDKPPRMRKKMRKQSPETSILSLPYDLLLNCLARVSRLYYPTLSLVSKRFRSVVASPDHYETRSLLHRTESCLYLCLRYHRRNPHDPNKYWFALCRKPKGTINDQSSGHLFIPIPSPHLRPAESMSIVAVGSNIYKIGGYMPSSSRVSVLDCRFNTWHKAPRMQLKRSSPSASLLDGKIYVAGGCEDSSSVNWVEVFDPKTRTWGNVANPGTETRPRAEVESFGIKGKLYLLGDENMVYDPVEARWNTTTSFHTDDLRSITFCFLFFF
ncbi:F-box/kelch-repeat protein [Raphanus sativus]|nr:F-box/kelch-repeat protein [Raphanus sativus]